MLCDLFDHFYLKFPCFWLLGPGISSRLLLTDQVYFENSLQLSIVLFTAYSLVNYVTNPPTTRSIRVWSQGPKVWESRVSRLYQETKFQKLWIMEDSNRFVVYFDVYYYVYFIIGIVAQLILLLLIIRISPPSLESIRYFLYNTWFAQLAVIFMAFFTQSRYRSSHMLCEPLILPGVFRMSRPMVSFHVAHVGTLAQMLASQVITYLSQFPWASLYQLRTLCSSDTYFSGGMASTETISWLWSVLATFLLFS